MLYALKCGLPTIRLKMGVLAKNKILTELSADLP